jgi:protoporphyrin/coproporphyrin ferrochelatase
MRQAATASAPALRAGQLVAPPSRRRLAVVLLQLGGPDSLEAVQPYLTRFFTDPAIIRLPRLLRGVIARIIAARRAPVTREIYRLLGGRSPILEQTEAQRTALESALAGLGAVRCFIAMRYWHPLAHETARQVAEWGADEVVLLPLYPQFSTTTTGSAVSDWMEAAQGVGLNPPLSVVSDYPADEDFVAAHVDLIRRAWPAENNVRVRLLFTAHGLPLSIVKRGDPYPDRVSTTARAIVEGLGRDPLDWRLAFQSRVTPQKWLEPSTEAEIRRAGADGVGLVLVPLAFVSEHSETLVELDLEYAQLAREHGVPAFHRVPALGTHPTFIRGLARLVKQSLGFATRAGTGRRSDS